ncbi:STS14 protein [Actinidia eriantha]|uniref:STS14 protein n=1 Tax=Actinidia eriantha TaxID=165200 RepID=UPI00258688DB|nr:STS14 protein [Actinidia eriantha]
MAKALLSLLVALSIFHITALDAPPPPPLLPPPPATVVPAAPPNATQEFLNTHNEARAEVGVEPLTWSPNLAKATSLQVRYQRDKMGCKFADLSRGKYGGNQLWASRLDLTPREAVGAWVEEKKYYDHANNSCAPDHTCGVYTQVVWKKSLELGCAQATCRKEGSSLTICFYNPPGNVIGESPY